jgi:hypothetical protein
MNNKITKNTLLTVLILAVFACPVFALPPDPDNAALLYYQAFCVYEKPDDTMKDMIRDVAKGRIEPNPTITKYIESCRPAIKLAAGAAELDKCHWGLKYSEGLDFQARHLAESRILTYLILSDARIALKKSNYDLAIQRCLTARKLGIDVGQDPVTVGFLVKKAIEKFTNECLRDILASGEVELQTLQQLKLQLDELDSRAKPLEFFLETEQEVMAMYITPERIKELLPWIDGEKEPGFVNVPDDARNYILNADQEFCQRNLAYYNARWSEVFSALKLPYEQAYIKLGDSSEKPHWDYEENPDATMTVLLAPNTARIYNLGIKIKTFSNAIKSALEIYEIVAQTGQLPNSLPAGLPKDLFSGKPFQYEKTADGFILRCQGKDLEEDNKIHEYEFKVKK